MVNMYFGRIMFVCKFVIMVRMRIIIILPVMLVLVGVELVMGLLWRIAILVLLSMVPFITKIGSLGHVGKNIAPVASS